MSSFPKEMPEHTPAPTYARSLYGFFMYIFSNITLFIYCAWAFLPDDVLHYFNIYYYPQKYWSVAIPIQFLLALTFFALFIYPSANLILSVSTDNIRTISDSHSITELQNSPGRMHDNINPCSCKHKDKCIKEEYNAFPVYENEEMIPHIQDLDIRIVCRKLYS